MDIHRYPWTSMDIMDIHGYPLISIDIHGYSWISMEISGYSWISSDINGYPWFSMDIHEWAGWVRWGWVSADTANTAQNIIDNGKCMHNVPKEIGGYQL